MGKQKSTRPLLGFYILVIYVLLQFVWWSYLMFNLNNEIYQLKTELIIHQATDELDATLKHNELQNKLHKRWMMIVGEGSVFLSLLVLGIVRTRNSFKKEKALLAQQKNFLLSVTHELKSPIAAIRLQLETLLHRQLNEDRVKELLQNAIGDSDRLHALVENILLASQIDNRGLFIQQESLNVKQELEKIVKRLKPIIQQEIRISCPIDLTLLIDKQCFNSIIQNLLENASKYSQQNTSIDIEAKQIQQCVSLKVIDQGKGIAENEQEAVFKKFYRIGNEETRSVKGTGLGLYIVKELVELNRGSISIKSEINKGSVFELSFCK